MIINIKDALQQSVAIRASSYYVERSSINVEVEIGVEVEISATLTWRYYGAGSRQPSFFCYDNLCWMVLAFCQCQTKLVCYKNTLVQWLIIVPTMYYITQLQQLAIYVSRNIAIYTIADRTDKYLHKNGNIGINSYNHYFIPRTL